MNYEEIYKSIIDRAKKENRIKSSDIYYESHHIIPRSIGGDNTKKNLGTQTIQSKKFILKK